MGVKENFERVKNKVKKHAVEVAIVAASILPGKSAEAQTMLPDTVKTSVSVDTNQIKHYLKFIEIPSLDALKQGKHIAEYNGAANAVIYNLYFMKNPTDYERQVLEQRAEKTYTGEVSRHEKLHASLSKLKDKLYDGTAFTLPSDRIRLHLLEEICAFKTENGYNTIDEALKNLDASRIDSYIRHYQSPANSIVVALSAEEKLPENINKEFTRTYDYKTVDIGGQEYIINTYKTVDGKYQTNLLHDGATDQVVTSQNIISQSGAKIGVLCDENMQPLRTADGKEASASFLGYNNQNDNYILSISNINKEPQGYEFKAARQNYVKMLFEYASVLGISKDDTEKLGKFLEKFDLSRSDPDEEKIKEIKETYQGVSLEESIIAATERYYRQKNEERKKFLADTGYTQVTDPAILSDDHTKKTIKEKLNEHSSNATNFPQPLQKSNGNSR